MFAHSTSAHRHALALLGAIACAAFGRADLPVIHNGSFEDTYDFSGWLVDRAFVGSFIVCETSGATAHGGLRCARFAAHERQFDTLRKTIAAMPGESFVISFWLRSDNIVAGEDRFLVQWENTTLLDLSTTQLGFPYQRYEFTVTATTAAPQLAFRGCKRIGSFRLDDVEILPPPPTRHCVDAPLISGGAYTGVFQWHDEEPDVDASCDQGEGIAEWWYRYVSQCSQTVRIDLCGSEMAGRISLWSGPCNGLIPLACERWGSECPGGAPQPVIGYTLEPGETYHIRVGAEPDQHNRPFVLNVISTRPENDLCENAMEVQSGATYIGTIGCTPNDVEASCAATDGDVWYVYRPGCSHRLKVDACGSDMNAVLSIYAGGCEAPVQIACADTGDNCVDTRLEADVLAGESYLIRVARRAGSPGFPFALNIAEVEGQQCRTAIPIAEGEYIADGRCLPHVDLTCNNMPLFDAVWYRYEPVETAELRLQVCTPHPTGLDLAVLKGSCDGLECFVNRYVPHGTDCDKLYPLDFTAEAGVTYYIRLACFGPSPLQPSYLRLSRVPPPPGDMNCDRVISVADIGPFVLAVTDPAAYAAQFPDCDRQFADVNRDGVVSVGDIAAFVAMVK